MLENHKSESKTKVPRSPTNFLVLGLVVLLSACAIPNNSSVNSNLERLVGGTPTPTPSPTPSGPTATSQNGFGGSGAAISTGLSSSFVLFQAAFNTSLTNRDGGAVKIDGVNLAYSFGAFVDPNASNAVKFFVADSGNHRILIYNTPPSSGAVLPDLVVGQPDFVTNTAHSGGGTDSLGFNVPYGVTVCTDGKMFVTDRNNHRVLGYNQVPTATLAPADFVVGQTTMTGNTSGTTANKFLNPTLTYCIQNRLFVLDGGNNRILIYNTIPSTTNPTADVVIGQANMTSGGASCAANGLSSPQGLLWAGDKLHVADASNHRVLVFNNIPTASGASADVALGQPDLVSCLARQGGAVAANNLSSPATLATNGTKLAVGDGFNNRITFYDLPVTTNQAATHVVGQANLTTATNFTPPNATSVRISRGLVFDGSYIWTLDYNNQRLINLALPF